MLTYIKHMLTPRPMPTLRDLERAYLDSSVSVIDLERRQREIDQGLFRRNSFGI